MRRLLGSNGSKAVAKFTFVLPAPRTKALILQAWRRGRVAEGGGLLNRYTVNSRIEGSNPSVSARLP
jgi:hypothetical protein